MAFDKYKSSFVQTFDDLSAKIITTMTKLIGIVFLFSATYVLFFRKLIIANVICNIFDGNTHHPNDATDAPDTKCRHRFHYMHYLAACCFLILSYFVSMQFVRLVFFYSPLRDLLSIISRIRLNMNVGFNVNFLIISFLLTYFLYALLYMTGNDESFISLLDMQKSTFAHSTYLVLGVFMCAFVIVYMNL